MKHLALALVAMCNTNCAPSTPVVARNTAFIPGRHALQLVDGKPLPVQFGVIPVTQGNINSGCMQEIRTGSLTLAGEAGAGTFLIEYDVLNSCTSAVVSQLAFGGQTIAHGSVLVLSRMSADGHLWTDTARVAGSAITLYRFTPRLVFAAAITP